MLRRVTGKVRWKVASMAKKDYEQLKDFIYELYKEGKLTSVLVNSSLLKKEFEASRLIILREISGDAIIGFVHYRKRNDGVLVIYEIGVAKKYRRRGAGRKLIKLLEQRYPYTIAMSAKCSIRNTEAMIFWYSLGFKPIDMEKRWNRRKNRYSYFIRFEKVKENAWFA